MLSSLPSTKLKDSHEDSKSMELSNSTPEIIVDEEGYKDKVRNHFLARY